MSNLTIWNQRLAKLETEARRLARELEGETSAPPFNLDHAYEHLDRAIGKLVKAQRAIKAEQERRAQ